MCPHTFENVRRNCPPTGWSRRLSVRFQPSFRSFGTESTNPKGPVQALRGNWVLFSQCINYRLSEHAQSTRFSGLIEIHPRRRMPPHQLVKLTGGASEAGRSLPSVIVAGIDHIQSLRQERRVIGMAEAAHNPFALTTRAPEVRPDFARGDGHAMFGGESKPQAFDGDWLVLANTSSFCRGGRDARGCMHQCDRGFDLVAVLAARTTGSATRELALGEEFVADECRRVNRAVDATIKDGTRVVASHGRSALGVGSGSADAAGPMIVSSSFADRFHACSIASYPRGSCSLSCPRLYGKKSLSPK